MEEYAKLLNTILTKVVFNHMTMFFVFLFIGFTFIPNELTLYLNPKTPAFFPDWFTLADFGALVFALVATIIWILCYNATKSIISKRRESSAINNEKSRLIKLLYALSSDEQAVLSMICLNRPLALVDDKTRLTIEKLRLKGVISYGFNGEYEVNPLIHHIVVDKLYNHIKSHH